MTRRPPSATLAPAIATVALLASGCSSTPRVGAVEVAALGSAPLVLAQDFREGVYTRLPSEESYWFASVPLETLAQGVDPAANAAFLHAQLVWEPEPGKTPRDATATNLVLRLVVLSKGEVGIYGGAAFCTPSGEAGAERTLEIEGGTLTLLEKTPGFHDLLSPARLDGTLAALPDDNTSAKWRRALSQHVTNVFGRPMWVSAPGAANPWSWALARAAK